MTPPTALALALRRASLAMRVVVLSACVGVSSGMPKSTLSGTTHGRVGTKVDAVRVAPVANAFWTAKQTRFECGALVLPGSVTEMTAPVTDPSKQLTGCST